VLDVGDQRRRDDLYDRHVVTRPAHKQERPSTGVETLSAETGGGFVELHESSDINRTLDAVADELHSQYLLGFAPPKRDGKAHDVEVRVVVKGLKPRARKSYIAPKPPAKSGGQF
jgi:hypothetical protein